MEKSLRMFFAVTKTSLYEVEVLAQIFPTLKKIALRGRSSVPVGDIINNGSMLSIGKHLILYSPNSSERRIEFINNYYWGGHTSSVVALFLDKEKALECFKSEYQDICDSHWLEETKEVLKAIGENHPAFEICHLPVMELVASNK